MIFFNIFIKAFYFNFSKNSSSNFNSSAKIFSFSLPILTQEIIALIFFKQNYHSQNLLAQVYFTSYLNRTCIVGLTKLLHKKMKSNDIYFVSIRDPCYLSQDNRLFNFR